MSINIDKSHNNKATTVTVGRLSLLFSYETLVAVRLGNGDWIVSENVWGPTTGRHIKDVTGVEPKDRLSRAEFVQTADEIVNLSGVAQ